MSTRSIIGTATDGGFEGRYCHTDGYPTCRGRQLLETYHELGEDWEAVRRYAIREEVGRGGYWSAYLTPSQAVQFEVLPETVTCDLCSGTGKRPHDRYWTRNGCNGCSSTGQMRNPQRITGFLVTGDVDDWCTETNDCGAGWVYLLSERGIDVLEGEWNESDGSSWERVGSVAWDDEPNWTRIECGEHYERCIHYAYVHFPEAEGTRIGISDWLAGVRA